ncbi:MAG TPA: ferric reductase-like transmembrane domain-containing protein [Pseudolabrys sp.]|nr:ferric reductase-like transmembrane domain-containing protein [Pseudolabrys sp.]
MTASWQLWRDKRGRLSILRIVTLTLLLMPAGKALVDLDAILHSARPINDLIHRAGFWALVFLGVTLAVTPLRRIARYGNLIDVRRMLGVGTFCYIATHLVLYIADQSFDLGKAGYEITHRVYLIIGGMAWLGLAALALTSTDGMMRRLGGIRWRRLHQIVYAIALLALVHYFQQTKADVTVPIFAAGLFAWLIGYRLLAWWRDTADLSTPDLFGLSLAISALTFAGEAIGIGIAFGISPIRVLDVAFDFSAGVRPGWQVLAAGLAAVALDLVRARWNGRAARNRTRPVAAE